MALQQAMVETVKSCGAFQSLKPSTDNSKRTMDFNDLLRINDIDPTTVAVLRHSFSDAGKHRALLWVASERPDLFDAFQGIQDLTVEGALERLKGKGYVAGFVGDGAGRALFVGLFSIVDSTPIRPDDLYAQPAYQELSRIGLLTRAECSNEFHRKFSMKESELFATWKGRLVVKWPPPERVWYRKSANNVMPVVAIHEVSVLAPPMPDWQDISLSWRELATLPRAWREALAHWRGIYFIQDETDGRSYVGSAYGADNLLGRWLNYATTGHGGNKMLKKRTPGSFRFSILQRLSPDADPEDVVRIESSWKSRLRTRSPHGLNEN